MLYLDTSVLLPLFVADAFTDRADRLIRSRQPVIIGVTDFAIAEAASALSSQVRAGQRPKADVELVFAEMDHWLAEKAESIDVESSDIVMATRLMRSLDLPLRTGDAIHLAVARRLDAVLATFDQRMAESAVHIGLEIATD
jgi:predicted nucleic acid-binding protein